MPTRHAERPLDVVYSLRRRATMQFDRVPLYVTSFMPDCRCRRCRRRLMPVTLLPLCL